MKKEQLNTCANISHYCEYPANHNYCTCWLDYCLWCKDEPKMTFEDWFKEAQKQYKERNDGWERDHIKTGVPKPKVSGSKNGNARGWRCG